MDEDDDDDDDDGNNNNNNMNTTLCTYNWHNYFYKSLMKIDFPLNILISLQLTSVANTHIT